MTEEETDKRLLDIAEFLWGIDRRHDAMLIRDVVVVRALNDKAELESDSAFNLGYASGFENARDGLLTDIEKKAINQSAELWRSLQKIVADGESRSADLRELIKPIHDIQRAIMAQAGARAYGHRLLGAGPVKAESTPDGVEPNIHMESREEFQWICENSYCNTTDFMAKICGSQLCVPHSIAACPGCDCQSRLRSGKDHHPKDDPNTVVWWRCTTPRCLQINYPSKTCADDPCTRGVSAKYNHSHDACPRCYKRSWTKADD